MIDRIRFLFRASSIPVLDLSRPVKQLIVIAVDACLCCISTWLAFYLRLVEFVDADRLVIPVFVSLAIAVSVFSVTGLYRTIFRFSGLPAIHAVARGMGLYGLFFITIFTVVGIDGTPRTVGIIQPLLLFFSVSASRVFAQFWLGGVYRSRLQKDSIPRVIIYGAGSAGRQVAYSLKTGHEMMVIGFMDDDISLHGQLSNGIKIFASEKLGDLIESKRVTHVLLAMPSISRSRRRHVLDFLAQHNLVVRSVPSITELAAGTVSVSDIKELDLDDLLGRETVPPENPLLSAKVKDRVVMVTGAGGSIGSELCRQIMLLQPRTLLLIETSEFALYSIHRELELMQSRSDNCVLIEIVPLICSVCDLNRLRTIISLWKPTTIYHAAAYKHVPLVEQNFGAGIENNVFGTLVLAQLAIELGVSDMILISTDKAVRPTNVMGATKRLSELILQALSSGNPERTCLSMVRFGNVLASSGSVIPTFREQILRGGPLTVTHPDVNRFFMTIPEAAQLVIQASALADGGDVFVLDMGEPIKIMELARRMINLSGLTIKEEGNPDGDIEIVVTGLRPGEKLFEELLIGASPSRTLHPKIMRATEHFIEWDVLEPRLSELKFSVETNNITECLNLLMILVEEFKHDIAIADWTHKKRAMPHC